MSWKSWLGRIAGAVGGTLLGVFTAGLGYIPLAAAGIGAAYYAGHEAAVQLGSRYKFRKNLRKDAKKVYTSADNAYRYNNAGDNISIEGNNVPVANIDNWDDLEDKIIVSRNFYNQLWEKGAWSKDGSRLAVLRNGQIVGAHEIKVLDQIKWNNGADSVNLQDKFLLPQDYAQGAIGEIKLVPTPYLTNYVKSGAKGEKSGRINRLKRRFDLWRGGIQPLKSFTMGGFKEPKEVSRCQDQNCTDNKDTVFVPGWYVEKKEIPTNTSVLRGDAFYKTKTYNVTNTEFKFDAHNYDDGWRKKILRTWENDLVTNLGKDIRKGKMQFFALPGGTENTLEEILEVQ